MSKSTVSSLQILVLPHKGFPRRRMDVQGLFASITVSYIGNIGSIGSDFSFFVRNYFIGVSFKSIPSSCFSSVKDGNG